MQKIKVLVADDSAFMRKIIRDIINSEIDMEVVDTARDGLDAIDKIKKLRPNLVTLDVEMPNMNGLEALKHIMQKTPTKVIMVSSLTDKNAATTIECLQLGAVDFIQKPSGSISLDFAQVKDELIEKIRSAVNVRVDRLMPKQMTTTSKPNPPTASKAVKENCCKLKRSSASKLLLIASSTGGPRSLEKVIPLLPEKIGCPGIVVQHMPPGFTKSLADRLNKSSKLKVKEASNGELLEDNTIYIAPGNYHLGLKKESNRVKLYLDSSERINGVRPAADFTFKTAVELYGGNIVCVVLTGMGKDGAEGAKLIKQKGGVVIAESRESCVVYGMPKAVVENGSSDFVLENTDIAAKLSCILTRQ